MKSIQVLFHSLIEFVYYRLWILIGIEKDKNWWMVTKKLSILTYGLPNGWEGGGNFHKPDLIHLSTIVILICTLNLRKCKILFSKISES